MSRPLLVINETYYSITKLTDVKYIGKITLKSLSGEDSFFNFRYILSGGKNIDYRIAATVSALLEEFGENAPVESAITEYKVYKARHKTETINHPQHYNSHPSGVECITVTEHMNFNIGNAIKYLWRSDHKNGLEDLKKAAWYINREIERLEKCKK